MNYRIMSFPVYPITKAHQQFEVFYLPDYIYKMADRSTNSSNGDQESLSKSTK